MPRRLFRTPKSLAALWSIALVSVLLPACGNYGSDEGSGVHDEGSGVYMVRMTEAEEATISCGEYGYGMGIGESDLPMVQCIIDNSLGKEGRAELFSGMMTDAIYSSNEDAVRILLDAGVDAGGKSPSGESFLFVRRE